MSSLNKGYYLLEACPRIFPAANARKPAAPLWLTGEKKHWREETLARKASVRNRRDRLAAKKGVPVPRGSRTLDRLLFMKKRFHYFCVAFDGQDGGLLPNAVFTAGHDGKHLTLIGHAQSNGERSVFAQ